MWKPAILEKRGRDTDRRSPVGGGPGHPPRKVFKIKVLGNGISGILRPSQRVVMSLIIWLAPWAGKINQILHCDWLPERARWSYLARSGLPAVSRKKNFPESHIINPLLTNASLFGQDGWILASFNAVVDLDSVSVHKHAKKKEKKNLANIQPSWPHTWPFFNLGGSSEPPKDPSQTNEIPTLQKMSQNLRMTSQLIHSCVIREV